MATNITFKKIILIVLLAITSIIFLIFLLSLMITNIIEENIKSEVQAFLKTSNEPEVDFDYTWPGLIKGKVSKLIIKTGPIMIDNIPVKKASFKISNPQINIWKYAIRGQLELIRFEKAGINIWMDEDNINDYLHAENDFLDWRIEITEGGIIFIYTFKNIDIYFKGKTRIAEDNKIEFQAAEMSLGSFPNMMRFNLEEVEGLVFNLQIDNLPLKMNLKEIKVVGDLIKIEAAKP